MRGFLGFLKVVVVGVALAAAARAIYRNRDKLKGGWKAVSGTDGLRGYADKLSVGKLVESVGSLKNLKDLVSQTTRLKKVV